MATGLGQYARVFLPGETPPWQKAWQAIVYRVAKSWTLLKWSCAHRCKTFLPVAVLPQWELSAKVAQLLGLQGLWWRPVCRDTDCLCCRSYSPIRVFFRASCSWRSEGLFGQSLSIAPPIQALTGVLLYCSHIRHIEGPLWLKSYSVVWRISHLKEHPGWGPTL